MSQLVSTIAFLMLGPVVLFAMPRSCAAVGTEITHATVLELLNCDRQANHVAKLRVNDRLTAVAQAKADDMAVRHYFSHANPEGEKVWGAVKAAGYNYRFVGENLARDFTDAVEQEKAWMASRTHRDNLLASKYRHVGIGVARAIEDGRKVIYVVTLFGKSQ